MRAICGRRARFQSFSGYSPGNQLLHPDPKSPCTAATASAVRNPSAGARERLNPPYLWAPPGWTKLI